MSAATPTPPATWAGPFVRIAAALAIALGFVACRPGEGDFCRCPGECRNGLVCAQSGAVIDSCIDPGPGEPAGRCIEQDGLADMADEAGDTIIGDYHDVGGKRDFGPSTASDPSDPSGDTTLATSSGTSSADTTTSSSSSSGTSESSGSDGSSTSSGSTTTGDG